MSADEPSSGEDRVMQLGRVISSPRQHRVRQRKVLQHGPVLVLSAASALHLARLQPPRLLRPQPPREPALPRQRPTGSPTPSPYPASTRQTPAAGPDGPGVRACASEGGDQGGGSAANLRRK